MKTVRTTEPADAEQLRAWLAAAAPEAWEAPQPVPGQPGRYTVRYVVNEPVTTTRPARPAVVQRAEAARRRWTRRRTVIVSTVVTAAVAGLVVAGYLAYLWAAAHAALLLGIAVVALVAVVLLLRVATRGDGCTVIHIRH